MVCLVLRDESAGRNSDNTRYELYIYITVYLLVLQFFKPLSIFLAVLGRPYRPLFPRQVAVGDMSGVVLAS